MQISTVNRRSTSLNGPVELQQNEHRAHSAPLALELTVDKHSGARNSSSATGIEVVPTAVELRRRSGMIRRRHPPWSV